MIERYLPERRNAAGYVIPAFLVVMCAVCVISAILGLGSARILYAAATILFFPAPIILYRFGVIRYGYGICTQSFIENAPIAQTDVREYFLCVICRRYQRDRIVRYVNIRDITDIFPGAERPRDGVRRKTENYTVNLFAREIYTVRCTADGLQTQLILETEKAFADRIERYRTDDTAE